MSVNLNQPMTRDDLSDLEIVNEEDRPIWTFEPVDEEWQTAKCEEFHLAFRKLFPSEMQSVALSNPVNIMQVEGDGNCWFRCVSLVVTGSQDDHTEIRQSRQFHAYRTSLHTPEDIPRVCY